MQKLRPQPRLLLSKNLPFEKVLMSKLRFKQSSGAPNQLAAQPTMSKLEGMMRIVTITMKTNMIIDMSQCCQ